MLKGNKTNTFSTNPRNRTEILLSHSKAVAMSGRVENSSMSCRCPPDCCSPEVEKDDGNAWFLIKVLFLKLFIPIISSTSSSVSLTVSKPTSSFACTRLLGARGSFAKALR